MPLIFFKCVYKVTIKWRSTGIFLDAQGKLTPKSEVESLAETLCNPIFQWLSSLPARMKKKSD